MRGITREQLGVRRTVLGTFSSRLTEFLAAGSGAVEAEHWLRRAEREAYLAGDNVTIATFPDRRAGGRHADGGDDRLRHDVADRHGRRRQPAAARPDRVARRARRRDPRRGHVAPLRPSDDEAVPSPRLRDAIERALRERGVAYATGASWTTDAVYREHRGKIDRYRAAGVMTVEMELSALFTVAAFRGVECAALLAISDELHGDAWDPGFGGEAFERAMGRAGMIALDVARGL